MEHQLVLGAGLIGGLVGTALASLGERVNVLVRSERLVRIIGQTCGSVEPPLVNHCSRDSCRHSLKSDDVPVDRNQDLPTKDGLGNLAVHCTIHIPC